MQYENKSLFRFISNDNKRRTKYIPKTLNPEWHQTLVFMDIPRKSINTKTIEVTVWDYDRFKNNDFMGEVKLNLAGNIIENGAY